MGVRIAAWIRGLVDDEAGASAVEYAVMLALILMVVFVAVQALGLNVNQAFHRFIDTFRSAGG